MAEQMIDGKLYRSVSLDEWMSQLASDHPAVAELREIRLKLAEAVRQLDRFEAENAALHQQILTYQLQKQPKEK
jgi:hypothetical protein